MSRNNKSTRYPAFFQFLSNTTQTPLSVITHQTPDRLKVQELRAGGKILMITLLCSKSTSKATLKALYRNRWQVELDIRNIKTTLGMEILNCRTPEMAEKELWVYLLAYNLIRLLMTQAALLADIIPR